MEEKKIKKKLAEMERVKETIIQGKHIIQLVKEREQVKKEMLCAAFNLEEGHYTNSQATTSEDSGRKKPKYRN